MKTLGSAVLALVFLIALALPGFGDDGGGNGGGTGVWVLPRANFLTAQTGSSSVLAASSAPIAQDRWLQMSPDVGVATATFVDDASGVAVSLQVTGSLVRVPAALLQALALSSAPQAQILISDATQLGYLITVNVNAQTQLAQYRVF